LLHEVNLARSFYPINNEFGVGFLQLRYFEKELIAAIFTIFSFYKDFL